MKFIKIMHNYPLWSIDHCSLCESQSTSITIISLMVVLHYDISRLVWHVCISCISSNCIKFSYLFMSLTPVVGYFFHLRTLSKYPELIVKIWKQKGELPYNCKTTFIKIFRPVTLQFGVIVSWRRLKIIYIYYILLSKI